MKNKLVKKLEELTGKKVILKENSDIESGLKVFGDINNIGSWLQSPEGNMFYAELSHEGNIHWFFPEEESHLDSLEVVLAREFKKYDNILSFTFEQKKNDEQLDEVLSSPIPQGNYSTAEMGNFLKTILTKIDFNGNGVRITIPSNFPSSIVGIDKDKVIQAWLAAKEIYKGEASWYIWDAQVGGASNKPKELRAQRYDLESILDIASKNPESVRGFSVGVTSNQVKKFSKDISTQGD